MLRPLGYQKNGKLGFIVQFLVLTVGWGLSPTLQRFLNTVR